jgi:hypothetical protein
MWRFFAADRVAFKRATHRTELPLVTVTEEVQGSSHSFWAKMGPDGCVSVVAASRTTPRATCYCVRTAIEVSPRSTPLLSVKVTNRRLTPGESGTAALPVTKMPKVGVAFG